MSFFALPAVLCLMEPWHVALALVLAVIAHRPSADLIRFATATPAARQHYLGMIRARHRWLWLCRCTGLAQPELAPKNQPAAESRALPLFYTKAGSGMTTYAVMTCMWERAVLRTGLAGPV